MILDNQDDVIALHPTRLNSASHVADPEPSASGEDELPDQCVRGKAHTNMPENFCVVGACVRYIPATSAASPSSQQMRSENAGPPVGERCQRG